MPLLGCSDVCQQLGVPLARLRKQTNQISKIVSSSQQQIEAQRLMFGLYIDTQREHICAAVNQLPVTLWKQLWFTTQQLRLIKAKLRTKQSLVGQLNKEVLSQEPSPILPKKGSGSPTKKDAPEKRIEKRGAVPRAPALLARGRGRVPLSICVSVSMWLSMWPCIPLSLHLSLCLSIYLSIYL